jgi:hypothetical protein
MPNTESDDQDGGLPPPGTRWGAGAQSVLPYLTKTLQAKPAEAPEQRPEGNMRPGDRQVFTNRPSAT